jgi:Icc protein
MQSANDISKRALVNQYPKPEHFIVHISDTHLLAGDENLYDSTANSDKNLRTLFQDLEATGCRPEAIVFTGDIADRGEDKAYQKVLEIVTPLADKIGAKLIWVMGNHDDRKNFRINLLDEYPSEATIDHVYNINGLRIISLDSSVIGHHYGEISDAQLEWLKNELATPAPHGTILAMHHPPIPSVLHLAAVVELQDQKKLADVIRGSDIRSIIAGHLHYSSNAMFAGIPVSVASATCYTQDLNVEVGGTRGRDGAQAFNLIHVYDDTVLHSVVPLGNFATVGKFVTAEETDVILANEGILVA